MRNICQAFRIESQGTNASVSSFRKGKWGSHSTLQVNVGPQSVGYRLIQDALIFGGEIVTASDVAVAEGLAEMGNAGLISPNKLSREMSRDAVQQIHTMLEDVIDRAKVI